MMLFLAVVKDFAFFAKMKIQFKRAMVHWLQHQRILSENPAYLRVNYGALLIYCFLVNKIMQYRRDTTQSKTSD